jgi:hypothetical protein
MLPDMDIEDEENCSPDLFGTLRRDDSEESWKATSQDREQDQIPSKISKDMLFLISLSAVMSLFTYVYFSIKKGFFCVRQLVTRMSHHLLLFIKTVISFSKILPIGRFQDPLYLFI